MLHKMMIKKITFTWLSKNPFFDKEFGGFDNESLFDSSLDLPDYIYKIGK
jgi:hypothetical protein